MTIRALICYNRDADAVRRRPEGHCYIKAVGHSLEKGVRLMGDKRWMKVLRFVLCVMFTVLVTVLTAPKAC